MAPIIANTNSRGGRVVNLGSKPIPGGRGTYNPGDDTRPLNGGTLTPGLRGSGPPKENTPTQKKLKAKRNLAFSTNSLQAAARRRLAGGK